MIRPIQLIRLMQINFVLMRYAINRPVLGKQSWWLRALSYLNPLSFLKQEGSRGESIRLALESLGPIFVKFGQMLSTRQDLLPADIAGELAKLQDQVPPFSSEVAIEIIEKTYGKKIQDLFHTFEEKPLASASVAQVHTATLHDGSKVIVKVLRPNIDKVIRKDIALLYMVARLTERFWSQGRRLRPVALVAEFERTIIDELDLMREAASASQLRRNFIDSDIMYVPKVYWAYSKPNVMVMERIYGIPISDIAALKAKKTNMKKLAERGVKIFFTQVFRDSFFHADMHPGNLFVDVSDPENPKYLGVDFGIMGTLNPEDQHYLAENLLAFFHRDYRRIAILHVESGWVPLDTRVDQFEATIRTVSEPIFEKPFGEISFGLLLLQLFQTAERFDMKIQPQLMLLQKTLLYIEGLGRQLYPELDLWTTAKPFMEDWITEQHGIKKIANEGLKNWETTAESMLKTPRLVYDVLNKMHRQQQLLQQQATQETKSTRRPFLIGAGAALLIAGGISLLTHEPIIAVTPSWQWASVAFGGLLLLFGCIPKTIKS